MYASLSLSLFTSSSTNQQIQNVKFKKVQPNISYVIQTSIFAFLLSSMPVNLTWFTLHSLHSIARQCQRILKTFKGFNPFFIWFSVMSSYQIQIHNPIHTIYYVYSPLALIFLLLPLHFTVRPLTWWCLSFICVWFKEKRKRLGLE